MYSIFTDSDCDITLKEAKEYGYKYISMPYIDDEKEIYPYFDFDEYDYHSYFERMRKGHLFSTCGLSPTKYIEYFEPEFKKGNDILYVHFSAAMTSTFDAMRIALDELKEKYPERKFYEIDTLGITLGSVALVHDLGKMYKEGKSIEELLEYGNKEVQHYAVYFYADNLKFFAKSGRVSGVSATMGDLIGIKPIIYMSKEGKMEAFKKVRGRKNAMHDILNTVAELKDKMEERRIYIGHADCIELAKEFGEMVKERFGKDLDIVYLPVNPTAGAHCGPDTIGISFHAKHR